MATELEAVGDLAREAGALALEQYHRVEAQRKSDESFVTAADRAVERHIRAELSRLFPHDAVVGEESGRSGPLDAERVWYVDPIDGTTNYVHGIGFWCVAIGLVQNHQPRLGALYDPVLDELYLGRVGQGASCNGRPLAPWDSSEPLSRTDPVVFPTNLGGKAPDLGPVRWRLLGSAQLHFALVARGSARAGLWLDNHPWDIVAGAALCLAAGCRVTHPDGGEVDWLHIADALHWRLVVAAPRSHAVVLRALDGRWR